MSGTLITAVTATSAVCAGVAGGVYFAFSAIVMPALRALPADHCIAAMRRINTSAVRLPFMAVFFGGAAASVALVVTELVSDASAPGAANRMAGAGLALAAFGITIVRNVPLNNELARNVPDGVDAAARWTAFDRGWSSANHARAVASLAAVVVFLDSLARSG